MRKYLNIFSMIAVLALVFIIAGCEKQQEQRSPIGPIIETTEGDGELTSTCASDDASSPEGIVPIYVSGNTPSVTPTNVKIDPPDAGTYTLGPGSVTITFTDGPCGEVMEWSVSGNIAIDHVYAKGGDQYNDYDYTGKNPRPTADGNIHCPINPSGSYADFSHVNFVFHEVTTPSYALTVSKTAATEYIRTYNWDIDKSGDQTALTLCEGEAFTVNYHVMLDAIPVDSDWKVTGTITIENVAPEGITAKDAVISSISDIAGGVSASLDCAIPFTLAAGATMTCNYSADLSGAINGTNTVTVVTNTAGVTGGTATADYVFGEPTTILDECVAVSDNKFGDLGSVCLADLPKTLTYSLDIEYDEFGFYTYTNTASFLTNDNGVTGSDSWDVAVTVCQCETAWGGDTAGMGKAWWFYYDVAVSGTQTIWAGQHYDAGTVTYDGANIVINLTDDWELNDVEEPVKIQGYDVIPTKRPAAGHFEYKGMDLVVPVSAYPFYAIHLDLRRCPQ